MSSSSQRISRRRFLKAAGTTATGLALAACGAAPDTATTAASEAAATSGASAAAEVAASTAAEVAASTAPAASAAVAAGEAAELTYIYPGTIFTDVGVVQDALNTILQERINATISLQTVDWGAFDEKIKLATAAGEKFDMTFTAPWINNYYQNVSNGNLLALDDMLQTQAPKLWDSMPAAFWDAARVDGKIHGVINQQIFVKPWGPFTRKDLAEKHGLDLSAMSKFEDLEPYFDKVKAEGITPVTRFSLFFNEYWGYDPLFDGGFVVRYDDPERKVLIAAETPEFKAAMELNRKWLAAGYMLEEELSADDERAQVRAGQYGGGIHVIKPGGESEAKATYGFDYVQRSFVAPHNGTEVLTTAGVVATLNGVSRTSANPERVVQFLELLNTDVEVYNLLCKGVEGKHWEWKDETRKIVGFPEGVTAETSAYNPNTDWMFGNQFNAYFVSEEQASANVWEETAKLNTSATPSVALGFSFNSDPVKTELAQLAAVGEEQGELVTYGPDELSEALPALIEALKGAGAEKVQAEVQRQLDEWAKTKGS